MMMIAIIMTLMMMSVMLMITMRDDGDDNWIVGSGVDDQSVPTSLDVLFSGSHHCMH